jgi:hypothetical protein
MVRFIKWYSHIVFMNPKEAVKKIHGEFCKRCEEKKGKKDIDVCFNCEWHRLFNEVYEQFNGENP